MSVLALLGLITTREPAPGRCRGPAPAPLSQSLTWHPRGFLFGFSVACWDAGTLGVDLSRSAVKDGCEGAGDGASAPSLGSLQGIHGTRRCDLRFETDNLLPFWTGGFTRRGYNTFIAEGES